MNRSEMKNLVTATLARHLNKNEQIVTEDAELFDDLQADSLDIVELTLEFEEMFKIEIPDDDLEQILTVRQIIDLIEKKESENMVTEEQQTPQEEQPEVGEAEVEQDSGDEGEGQADESDESGEESGEPEEE